MDYLDLDFRLLCLGLLDLLLDELLAGDLERPLCGDRDLDLDFLFFGDLERDLDFLRARGDVECERLLSTGDLDLCSREYIVGLLELECL